MTAIYGSSPWTRDAIKALTPDELAQIDAILPADMYVTVGAERKPGAWSVRLFHDIPDANPKQLDMVKPAHNLVTAVQTLVTRYAEGSR